MHRAPRRHQPTSEVTIDWSNPLAQGLTFAYLPVLHRVELVRRRRATNTGITWASGQVGRSFSAAGNTNEGVDFGAVQVISSSTAWSIAVLAAPAQTVGDQTGMFSQRSGAGNVEQINLMRGTGNLLSDDERDFQVYYRNDAGSPYYADNSSTHVNGPDGALHLWGGTLRSISGTLTLDILRDGVIVTENRTTPSGTFVSTNQNVRLGNLGSFAASGKYAKSCPQFLSLVWGARALSDAEWRELNRNPWQVFQPIRRRIYSFDTGGAVAAYLKKPVGERPRLAGNGGGLVG